MGAAVKAMGVPLRGVEVLSVAGTKVIGTARTDGEGNCAIADGATAIAARFTEQFLGVIVQPVVDGRAEIDVDRAQIVRLTGDIHFPEGMKFDWVDVKLTPRVSLPPTVVLRDDGGLREAMWIRRYTTPSFELRVIKGTWEVRAGREIDGGLPRPINLQLAAVTCGEQHPEAKFMGFEVQIDRDAKLDLMLAEPNDKG